MVGTFILCGIGLFAFGSSVINTYGNGDKRREALNNKQKYYWDNANRMKAVDNNEPCMDVGCDLRFNGHHILAGCETNRIIHDYTLETKDRENAKAKADGKKYEWREYPGWYGNGISKSEKKSCFRPYDSEKGLPYKLEYRMDVITCKGSYIKTYFKLPADCCGISAEISHTEQLTKAEALPWMYAGGSSRFFI